VGVSETLERSVEAVGRLRDLVRSGPGLVVLTGAGMSTDSGIPDYRGPNAVNRTPMTFQEFCSGPVTQQRYWARSYVGWQRMSRALPNDGHRALAVLEDAGHVSTLITQNVDGLHHEAGSQNVVDLHGRVDEVICLSCRAVTSRAEVQRRLDEANPGHVVDGSVRTAPDGDVLLEDTDGFVVVDCASCGGVLKPHVVFFGESVAPEIVERCFAEVDEARALLVLGSSLTVHSGLRFVRRAAKNGIPIAIVNRGATRADELATLRIDDGCSETLRELSDRRA
jgi:NAD-dependent SIR2 family protein deacetylase